MHGPHYWHISFLKISEKSLIVKEIAVDVVDVDNVGPNFVDFLDKLQCGMLRCEAMAVGEACGEAVQRYIEPIPDGYERRTAWLDAVAPIAVGYVAFPAVLYRQLSDFLHYAAGGG